MRYTQINSCRICGNRNLLPLLHLGEQALTGIFPRQKDAAITSGPLELVKCHAAGSEEVCGLVQLHHSYDLGEMYGANYGYRSGLNASMVAHLDTIVQQALSIRPLSEGDTVLDIGSNDGTLLSKYPADKGLLLAGMDPTGAKFRQYYPEHVKLVPDFFSAETFKENFPGKKARIVTSIAMFYDLEEPMKFVKDVAEILADDGIWIFEQSYLPSMLGTCSYDTMCHEHLEYYALKQIQWMAGRAGLHIIDVSLNDVNGGSFRIAVSRKKDLYPEGGERVKKFIRDEAGLGLDTPEPYRKFSEEVLRHKKELTDLVRSLNREGKKVFGYGASTKGNVLLQYCGFTPEDIPCIAEVNGDKFGAFTPGTGIPILSEQEAKKLSPDYFLVLPWHFREMILQKEQEFRQRGGRFIFPLPKIEIV